MTAATERDSGSRTGKLDVKDIAAVLEGDWVSLNEARSRLGLPPVLPKLSWKERNDPEALQNYARAHFADFPDEWKQKG